MTLKPYYKDRGERGVVENGRILSAVTCKRREGVIVLQGLRLLRKGGAMLSIAIVEVG